MKLKQVWSGARFGVRLLILAAAALMIMLLTELVCNYNALTTADLKPQELRLDDFYIDGDKAAFEDGALRVQMSRGEQVHIIYFLLDEHMETLQISIEGIGAVNVSVYIKDEASAYQNQTVYSVFCVADDPQLSSAALMTHSAGVAGEFTLRFNESPVGCDFYIRSVTINAPIPFAWQPVRMAGSFAVSLLLLCALLLRGIQTAYDPKRIAHRLIVILPLAAVMVLCGFLSVWSVPDQPLFGGISKEAALQNEDNDCYAALFATLLDGRLALAEAPSEDLLYLNNPYDPSERSLYNADFHLDFVLFDGQYYVYYGLGPIAAVYAPFYALTGRVPTGRDATLLMGWFTILMIGWAVCGLAKRYHKTVNVFALSLGCVTAVFASGVTILVTSPYFYYTAVLSFVGFSAAAVGFLMHAAQQKTAWLRITQYALAGLAVALAAMSRVSATPILLAMLLPLCIYQLVNKKVTLADAAALLSPMLLGLGVILWYNWARFGSVADFGIENQLTLLDTHYKEVRLSDLPHALYYYLLSPLTFQGVFPYIQQSFQLLPTAGHAVFSGYTVGILTFPVTWAVLLMKFGRRKPATLPAKRLVREERWTYLAPLIVSLPIMLITFSLAGSLMRYTCDFRLFFALAGVGCALPVMTQPTSPERKALLVICAAVCVLTILIGFGLAFENTAYTIRDHSPAVYYGLQRMFFPY